MRGEESCRDLGLAVSEALRRTGLVYRSPPSMPSRIPCRHDTRALGDSYLVMFGDARGNYLFWVRRGSYDELCGCSKGSGVPVVH